MTSLQKGDWSQQQNISFHIKLLTSFRIVEGNSPNPSKSHFSRSQRIGFPIHFEPTRRGQTLYKDTAADPYQVFITTAMQISSYQVFIAQLCISIVCIQA